MRHYKAISCLVLLLCGAVFGIFGLEGSALGHRLFGFGQEHLDLKLACLSHEVLAETKEQARIDIALDVCAEELSAKLLGTPYQDFGDDFHRALLAMTVAHNAAPYGGSLEMSYEGLIREEALDCDNYAALMGYLLPDQDLNFIGFDSGHIGNHAQVLFHDDDYSVLFDPTIGVAAITSYDDLLTGQQIGGGEILSVYPKPENKPAIAVGFHNKVVEALSLGLYKPSDALYFYDDMDYFLGLKKTRYLTPGGRSLRLRRAS